MTQRGIPPSLKKHPSENGHWIFQIWFWGQQLFKKKYQHITCTYIYIYYVCICIYIHILATKNVKTPYRNDPGGYGIMVTQHGVLFWSQKMDQVFYPTVRFFWGKFLQDLPSGKRLHNYGKSPLLLGKSTINGPCSIVIC